MIDRLQKIKETYYPVDRQLADDMRWLVESLDHGIRGLRDIIAVRGLIVDEDFLRKTEKFGAIAKQTLDWIESGREGK